MAVWDTTIPADTIQYSTISTYIQNLKTDIVERMRCTNSDGVDEHNVYGASVTGRHAISQVGFVKTNATSNAFETFNATYLPGDGTLHYIEDISTLYVKRNNTLHVLTTLDHGSLAALTTLADHTQYLATDGSRTMLGNITLDGPIVAAEIGDEDTDPIAAAHTTQSWYAAHGANAITTTHFKDDTQTRIHAHDSTDSDRITAPATTVVFDIILTGYEFCFYARQSGEEWNGGTLGLKYTTGTGTRPVGIADLGVSGNSPVVCGVQTIQEVSTLI